MSLEIRISQGGGKAGLGRNKTSTIQVVEYNGSGYFIKKAFRYDTVSQASKLKAIQKAQNFISKNK